ncbi:MAG: 30S ribosomal protein S5 [bacterium]
MNYKHLENDKQQEKVVQIRRICKVVKGGKKMSFRAVVIVGDGAGTVGVGVGKANEVSAAIRKSVEDAKKHQIKVPMIGHTIPHNTDGKWGASKVVIRPAPMGTGVIAGGAVRTVLELAGIADIVAKSIGASNSINTARATIEGLRVLKTLAEEDIRGKKLDVRFVQSVSSEDNSAGEEG